MVAVFGDGIIGPLQYARHVPHFENLVLRTEPNTITERDREPSGFPFLFPAFFPTVLDRDHRVVGAGFELVERVVRCRLFDQEIVDKQLLPDVDEDHFGGGFQVRHVHWLDSELFQIRRPWFRQNNAVIQFLTSIGPT